MNVRKTSCCGIREIDGIIGAGSSKQAFKEVWRQFSPMGGSFIMFSCPTKYKMGRKFKQFIERHNLGTVHVSEVRKNPNSGNLLRMYMWTVNHKECQNLFKKLQKQYGGGVKVGDTVELLSTNGRHENLRVGNRVIVRCIGEDDSIYLFHGIGGDGGVCPCGQHRWVIDWGQYKKI